MTLSIAIAGVAGRMGGALIRAVSETKGSVRVVGATARDGSPTLGQSFAGAIATKDVAAAAANADVWIDFTTPAATLAALDALAGTKVRAAIVGTTGLSAEQNARVAQTAKRIAIVQSGNFSLGITLLASLVKATAARLGANWDIEIVETHHRRKVDAPSGTALILGEAAANGRGKTLDELRIPPRDGLTGARAAGGIGVASVRAGGVIGEHEVRFASEREVLTLSHQALDRAVFADGALAAAIWVADKPPGLYSMDDVLGL